MSQGERRTDDLDSEASRSEYDDDFMQESWRASQDSDLCLHTSLGLSRELLEVLYNPTAKEWDSGFVILGNGKRFGLWTRHHPPPESRENEDMDAFTARQIAERQRRYEILANRAQRIAEARRAHRSQQRDEHQARTEGERQRDEEERARRNRQREVERLASEL